MHALWKKRLNVAADTENVVLYQDNAPYHTTRNTLLESDVLGFQRAIHQPYKTDLTPLDFIFFLIWSRIYEEHDLMIELRSVLRYKKVYTLRNE